MAAPFPYLLGVVRINPGSAAIAELLSARWDDEVQMVNDNENSDAWESAQVGRKKSTGEIVCQYDDADTTGQDLLTLGASVTIEFLAEGVGVGNPSRSGVYSVTGIGSEIPEGDGMVKRTYRVMHNDGGTGPDDTAQ